MENKLEQEKPKISKPAISQKDLEDLINFCDVAIPRIPKDMELTKVLRKEIKEARIKAHKFRVRTWTKTNRLNLQSLFYIENANPTTRRN